LNPKFRKEFLIWLKTLFGESIELEIRCEQILEKETYEGIVETKIRNDEKEKINKIKNLSNVKKIEELFKVNIKNIKR